MALSNDARRRLKTATTSIAVGAEIANAIDAQAANIAPIGVPVTMTGIDVATLRGEAEARLLAVESKTDAIIAALISGGLMAA